MNYSTPLATVLALGISLALGGCLPEKEAAAPVEKAEAIRLVRSIIVQSGPVTPNLKFSGEIKARYESQLAFRVAGKIVERKVDVGDTVKAGQVLFRLDARDFRLAESSAKAALNQARAEQSLAQQNFSRFEELKTRGLVSNADYDRYATALSSSSEQVQRAKVALTQARNQSSYSTLKADNDGIINVINAEVGQVVAAGQAVAQVERQGSLEAEIAVPEQQRAQIQRDTPATIQLWASPGKTYQATVREISPSADPITRTYRTRLNIDNGDALKPGMTANIEIASTSREAILLPLSAMSTKSAQPQVWRIDTETLTAQPVDITTGELLNNDIEIISGVNPGDRIVTAGANLLIPGQTVRIED